MVYVISLTQSHVSQPKYYEMLCHYLHSSDSTKNANHIAPGPGPFGAPLHRSSVREQDEEDIDTMEDIYQLPIFRGFLSPSSTRAESTLAEGRNERNQRLDKKTGVHGTGQQPPGVRKTDSRDVGPVWYIEY